MENDQRVAFCTATAHPRCYKCAHEAKWKELNQMPGSLRVALQSSMERIDPALCDDMNGAYFESMA